MIDDGTHNKYGGEIAFRANLENELRKGKSQKYYENRHKRNYRENGSYQENDNNGLRRGLKKDIIPMVLIVVQGWLKILINYKIIIMANYIKIINVNKVVRIP